MNWIFATFTDCDLGPVHDHHISDHHYVHPSVSIITWSAPPRPLYANIMDIMVIFIASCSSSLNDFELDFYWADQCTCGSCSIRENIFKSSSFQLDSIEDKSRVNQFIYKFMSLKLFYKRIDWHKETYFSINKKLQNIVLILVTCCWYFSLDFSASLS